MNVYKRVQDFISGHGHRILAYFSVELFYVQNEQWRDDKNLGRFEKLRNVDHLMENIMNHLAEKAAFVCPWWQIIVPNHVL